MKKKVPKEVQEKLAREFHRSIRTIRDWISCGLPCSQKGYDHGKVVAWLKSRSGADEDHDKWAAEWRKWRSRRQKLEYQKEAGKLVDREAVEKKMREFAELYRSTLLRLPRVAATEIFRITGSRDFAFDVEAAVFRHCNQTLGEVYAYLKEKRGGNSTILNRPFQTGNTQKTDQTKTQEKITEAKDGREEINSQTATDPAEKGQPDPG